jgi:hypothetical protein
MATGSYPATDLPPLPRDASSDRILKHLMTRVQTAEAALKSQELKNEMFSRAFEQDKHTNDRFDELTHRVVLLERNMSSDKKRLTKLETSIFTVLSVQSKMESALKLMDQKIIALIRKLSFNHSSGGGTGTGGGNGGSAPSPAAHRTSHSSISRLPSLDGDGTDLFEYSPHADEEQLALDNILHASIGDLHSPLELSELQAAAAAGSLIPSAPKYESPVVREKKELLRSISLKKSQSGVIDEETAEEGDEGEAGNGAGTADSQALMEEFLLEKIESLDLVVNEEILQTLASQQKTISELSRQLHDIQTNGVLAKKSKGSSSLSSGAIVWRDWQEEERHVLCLEMDQMVSVWREVYDELDGKVGKIEFLMKQVQKTVGDEIYRKLCEYRVFLREQLKIVSSKLQEVREKEEKRQREEREREEKEGGEEKEGRERRAEGGRGSKEEMARVMIPFFEELINRSEEIQEMESALQRAAAARAAGEAAAAGGGGGGSEESSATGTGTGTGVPLMAISRSPSHLPEKILKATELTLPLLEFKYLKHQFHKELQRLHQTLNSQSKEDPLLTKLLSETDFKFEQLQLAHQELSRNFLAWEQNSNQNSLQIKETMSKNYSEIMKRITTVSQLSNKNIEVNQKIEKLSAELREMSGRMFQENGREEIDMLLETLMNEMKLMKRSLVENETHLMDKLKRKADHQEIDK